MSGIQKAIKIGAICLAIFIIANIIAAFLTGLSYLTNFNAKNKELENFTENYQNIDSIKIDVSAVNVIIKEGTKWELQGSNLSSTIDRNVQNKTLKIEEKQNWIWKKTSQGSITITVPSNDILEKLDIGSGAGTIELENLTTTSLDVDQGAGILKLTKVVAQKTEIDGGAGEIKIIASSLNNLDLDAGVGKIDINANITGTSKIDCGVGEINLELLGQKEDYKLIVEKGIGSIKIEENKYSSDTTYGTGLNKITIDGGVGSIHISFFKN